MEEVGRRCGPCSLCCSVLRVDPLRKPAGQDCPSQRVGRSEGGCAIHERRPPVCRRYRCLWLQGGLEPGDRPDRLGAVLDLVTRGETPALLVHEAEPGAYERSERLRALIERFRVAMPVRILDTRDLLDPDRPSRRLLPGGLEERSAGDWLLRLRDGVVVERRRLPPLDRWLRRLAVALRLRWLRGRYRQSSGLAP